MPALQVLNGSGAWEELDFAAVRREGGLPILLKESDPRLLEAASPSTAAVSEA